MTFKTVWSVLKMSFRLQNRNEMKEAIHKQYNIYYYIENNDDPIILQ